MLADSEPFADEGHSPDPRTMSILRENGIADYEHSARKIQVADLDTFDYILAMDNENVHDLLRLKTRVIKNQHAGFMHQDKLLAKVMLFGDFGGKKGEQVLVIFSSVLGAGDLFRLLRHVS